VRSLLTLSGQIHRLSPTSLKSVYKPLFGMTCTVATGNAVTKDKTFILIFASYFNSSFGPHMKFGLQFAFEGCPTGFSVAFCPCRAFLYQTDPAIWLWPKRWH
jgi:hypothetical protein